MACSSIKLQDGTTAIVCGRGRRAERCGWCAHTPGEFQCDWKIGKGRTCDKHLCATHAREVAPDKHLCPEHQKTYAQWLATRAETKPGTRETKPADRETKPAPALTDERRATARQHTQALKEKLRGAQ